MPRNAHSAATSARWWPAYPEKSTKQTARVDENLGALEVELTPAAVARITAAVPAGAAAGTRYPEALMSGVYL